MDAVLFDIGNVLVRFDFNRAVQRVAQRASASPQEISSLVHGLIPALETGRLSSEAFLEEVRRRTGFQGTCGDLQDAYCDIFRLHQPMWELVRRLHGRMTLCLFSNTSELHLAHIRRTYPEFDLIPQGIYSMRVGAMKPDRAIYDAAVNLLDTAPERILYIDDLPANIQAGHAHGFRSILYDPEQHPILLRELATLPGKFGQ
ncbi:MAG: HAD family phosphatase [Verrucomicrobiales bacterium]|nr:HAD family phosphatase [Verrucomicrobiales bacterium]